MDWAHVPHIELSQKCENLRKNELSGFVQVLGMQSIVMKTTPDFFAKTTLLVRLLALLVRFIFPIVPGIGYLPFCE